MSLNGVPSVYGSKTGVANTGKEDSYAHGDVRSVKRGGIEEPTMSPAERCDEILRLIDQELVAGAAGDGQVCKTDDANAGDPVEANRVGTETST